VTSKAKHISAVALAACLSGCEPAETQKAPDVLVQSVAQFPAALDESSALAFHDNVLWSLNDSGNDPVLFGLSESGELLAKVTILNGRNTDWESLAQDESYLYVADTGNNFNSRGEFRIYRVPIPALEQDRVNADVITLRYADYESGNRGSHNFDSEALAVRGSELWLFTKNRGDGNSDLYRLPKLPGTYSVVKAQTLPVDSLVTAADINPETGELALLSYGGAGFGRGTRLWWAPTTDAGVDWDYSHSLSIGPADQWEAVVWRNRHELFLTHENLRQGFAGLASLSKLDED
jgi:hypothetical protein